MDSRMNIRADLADHVCSLPILRADDISPETSRGRASRDSDSRVTGIRIMAYIIGYIYMLSMHVLGAW